MDCLDSAADSAVTESVVAVVDSAWKCAVAGTSVMCMTARRLWCPAMCCDRKQEEECCQSSACVLLLPPPSLRLSASKAKPAKRPHRERTTIHRPLRSRRSAAAEPARATLEECPLAEDCSSLMQPAQVDACSSIAQPVPRDTSSNMQPTHVEAHPPCGNMFSLADGASCVTFTHSGRRVASGGCDGIINIWQSEKLQPERQLLGHESWILGVCSHPTNEDLLLSCSRDETVRLWDLSSGAQVSEVRPHGSRNTLAMGWSHSGESVLTGSTDSTLRVWDVHTWKQRIELTGHEGWVTKGAQFLDGDTSVISGSRDYSLRLWDVRSGKQSAAALQAHDWDITELTALGDTVLSVSRDGNLRQWDLRMLSSSINSLQTGVELYGVALCAKTSRVCAGGKGGVVFSWESSQLKHLIEHEGPTMNVTGLCASPVDSCIASVCEDGWLRTHETASK